MLLRSPRSGVAVSCVPTEGRKDGFGPGPAQAVRTNRKGALLLEGTMLRSQTRRFYRFLEAAGRSRNGLLQLNLINRTALRIIARLSKKNNPQQRRRSGSTGLHALCSSKGTALAFAVRKFCASRKIHNLLSWLLHINTGCKMQAAMTKARIFLHYEYHQYHYLRNGAMDGWFLAGLAAPCLLSLSFVNG